MFLDLSRMKITKSESRSHLYSKQGREIENIRINPS